MGVYAGVKVEYALKAYLDTAKKLKERLFTVRDQRQGIRPFHSECSGYSRKAYRARLFNITAITNAKTESDLRSLNPPGIQSSQYHFRP
jgi:hypothetical protein